MNRYKSAVIYTDGACSNNGRPGEAQAGIGVYFPNGECSNISERIGGRQTNQRAEIIAASEGIKTASKAGFTDVTVRTDSNYVKDATEKWFPNWDKTNAWENREIVNKNEFQELRGAMQGINVKFQWVPSSQNAADRLAREGSKKINTLRRFIR